MLSITVPDFQKRKMQKSKITMVTCYDSSFAEILNHSPIDVLLIGDSAVMVMHGAASTVVATVELMEWHTRAVASKASQKFIVADMPFLSVRKGKKFATEAAEKLIRAGAHAIKIEGTDGNEKIIRHLVESGIPVMGHIGLTPQFVHAFGGMKVQAKNPAEKEKLLKDAKLFADWGAFSLVIECVPHAIATQITETVSIPTIGIGAGVNVDGQVLVLQDLLGFKPDFKPKFLKNYLDGFSLISEALKNFHTEVQSAAYPTAKESYEG